MRIAVCGIGHETNTFSTLRTKLEDFNVRRGEDVVKGEFWDGVRAEGVELLPGILAGATPHGLVELSAYESLKTELLESLRASLPVDGVFLFLHGAMEVETIGDGETDLAGAVRQMVGPDVPIVCPLDLHGNLSPEFVASVNVLTALRTAPHGDGPELRARAFGHLIRCVKEGRRPMTAMVKLPLLLPGEHAVTDVEPSRSLYNMLLEIEKKPGIWDASLMIACAWTDSPYTSVSTLVVSEDPELAEAEAEALAAKVWERRHEFGPEVETVSVDEAIAIAKNSDRGPFFISDSGDNVTAGGAGDIPLFIEKLLAARAEDALVAGLTDAAAVAQCAEAGLGAEVELSLGGKLDHSNAKPLSLRAKVIHLDSKMAVVRADGVTVLIIDGRRPFHTLAAFEPSGIDPLTRRIVVVKQGYLAPELRERCSGTVMALSPGFTDLRLPELPYRRVKRPIYPLDPIESR